MDAFGYKTDENGKLFLWLLVTAEQETVMFAGRFGEIQKQYSIIGEGTEDVYLNAIAYGESMGYVFDFNDKCRELLVRFPLVAIADVAHFRLEVAEPVIDYALQRSGNGFCDYGFCDAQYLNLMAFAYNPDTAAETIRAVLKQENVDCLEGIWISESGVAQTKIG